MAYIQFKKLSISLPTELLTQIDKLARRDYASRSALIQQVLLEFAREHGSKVATKDGTAQPTPAMIDRMRQEFPFVPPDDIELLQFSTYYKYNQE